METFKNTNGNQIDLSKIGTKFRNEKSISGYDFSVVKSALQKYIRRNNVDMALKMLMELYCFDYVEGGKRILTNGLHRLQIIFLEDIGCGNIKLWNNLMEWFDIIYNERKKENRNRDVEILNLKKIVVNLCNSRKIRCGSYMNTISIINKKHYTKIVNCKYIDNFDGLYNLDQLNLFLKEKSWKSIVILRQLLYNLDELKRKEKVEMAMGLNCVLKKYINNDYLDYSKQWKTDIGKLKEGYLLYFVPLCDYLYGSDELQLIEEHDEFDAKWDANTIGNIELDDYVYDKHVKNAKNRSSEYFAIVSSIVEPESKNVKLPKEFEIIYKWLKMEKQDILDLNSNSGKKKKIWNFPDTESKLDFICRAQLVTSMHKTDTYYVKGVDMNKEQIWLVKGPFIEKNEIKAFIKYQKLKRKMGLNYVKSYLIKMKVDRWPERPGIGMRHKFKVDDYGYFMMSKSIIKMNELVVIEHPGSKKWGPTNVIDLKKFSVNLYDLNDKQMVDYLNNIGFRLKYNIGDLADRNFIVVGDRVYSVDENKKKSGVINLLNEFKKNKYKYFCDRFELLKSEMKEECVGIIETTIQTF
jgi:hypothetical protein